MQFKDLVKECKVWLDLSTYCNASCPQCHRTDKNGLDKVEWLPLVKWSLEDFVKKIELLSSDEAVYKACQEGGSKLAKDFDTAVTSFIDQL